MALTNASMPTKRRILAVCVKLFLERGYRRTTLAEIIKRADVSCSSFQNIFGAKDGVLTELVEFMFGNQFSSAKKMIGNQMPPVYVYALETVIQLTLTEMNENLREIYVESYTKREALEYIYRNTAKEIGDIFKSYLPEFTDKDFFIMEVGSSGIMRSYMARKCDERFFTLEKKIDMFLEMSLSVYQVPPDERKKIIEYIHRLDIRSITERVMQNLFESLEMRYSFELDPRYLARVHAANHSENSDAEPNEGFGDNVEQGDISAELTVE